MGTQKINIRDACNKKRHVHGFKHHKSKLEPQQIEIIRDMWIDGITVKIIGNVIGLTASGVEAIVKGRSRPDVFHIFDNIALNYPHHLYPPWFWKRTGNGWKAFRRRPANKNAGNVEREITCAICGENFIAKRSFAKYCSGKCAGQSFRNRQALRDFLRYIRIQGIRFISPVKSE